MNLTLQQGGLSARRKTSNNILSRFYYSSPVGIFLVITLLISACQEKTNGQDQAENKKTAPIAGDSSAKPKVNIQVNKHYDDKGNVIGFDSTYTSFYSNVEGDTIRMDSLMDSFDQYFNKDYSSFFKNDFNALFFKDSLRYPDFFHNDFFLKRYELNDRYFRNMMNRMDSIKNRFYQEHSQQEKDKKTKDL